MAKIFISYAHEDAGLAQSLYHSLGNLGHMVFFDRANLKVGGEYHTRIAENIRESDFAILLLSPDYFSEGSYCQTELKVVQSNWPVPNGRIFPVMVRQTPWVSIPPYISSVAVLIPKGNLVAEVVQTVQDTLNGFSEGETLSGKIKRLETENQLEALDLQWEKEKARFLIKINEKEFAPSVSLAVTIGIIFMAFAGYLLIFFTDPFFGGFSYVFIALFVLAGIVSFSKINGKAEAFAQAKALHEFERKRIIEKLQSLKRGGPLPPL